MQFSSRSAVKSTGLLTGVILLGLLTTMLLTTPDKLGPFGITTWFTGLLFALGGVLSLLLYYGRRKLRHSQGRETAFIWALRYGILSSTWFVALVALNSLRQLGLKDIVLVSLLVGLIEFYLRRSR